MSKEPITCSVGELIELYRKYNRNRFDADILVCAQCQSWLHHEIYVVDGGLNICGTCYKKSTHIAYRNGVLESMLSYGQYPCKYSTNGCKFRCVYENIIVHEITCKFNMYCFCKLHFKSVTDMMTHLKRSHLMETITINRPVANVRITFPQAPHNFTGIYAYHLSCGSTSLVALVKKAGDTISLSVKNVADTHREMKFMYKLVQEGTEFRRYSDVRCNDNKLIFPEDAGIMPIPNLKENKTYNIKIYFERYEEIEPFECAIWSTLKDYECPVCLDTITDTCYQCVNGHNVCSACRLQLGSCPLCRCAMSNVLIQLKGLMGLLKKPCLYIDNGCFKYINNLEHRGHQLTCPMRPIACHLCYTSFYKKEYFQHMIAEHSMEMIDTLRADLRPGFFSYDGKVFRFNYVSEVDYINMIETRIYWYLYEVHSPESEGPYDYSIEVVINDLVTTINSRTQKDDGRDLKHCLSFPYDIQDEPTFILTFLG